MNDKEVKLKTEKEIRKEFREQIAKIKVLVEVQPSLADYLNPIIAELIELNNYPRTRQARLRFKSPEMYMKRYRAKRTPEAEERHKEYNRLRGRMVNNGTYDKYMAWRNANKARVKKPAETMKDMCENNKTDLEVMKEFCEGKREK